jgi:hypothetical protein
VPKLIKVILATMMLTAASSYASTAYAQTNEVTPPGAEDQQDQELPPDVPPEALPDEQTMPDEQELPPDVPPEALPDEQTAPRDQDLPDGQ